MSHENQNNNGRERERKKNNRKIPSANTTPKSTDKMFLLFSSSTKTNRYPSSPFANRFRILDILLRTVVTFLPDGSHRIAFDGLTGQRTKRQKNQSTNYPSDLSNEDVITVRDVSNLFDPKANVFLRSHSVLRGSVSKWSRKARRCIPQALAPVFYI